MEKKSKIIVRIATGIFLFLFIISFFIAICFIVLMFSKFILLFFVFLCILIFVLRKIKLNSKQVEQKIESYDLENIPSRWQESLEELKIRREVWIALSEFFLDTQLDEKDLQRICKLIENSTYSNKQINYILWYEVAPLVQSSVLSTTGEWNSFGEKWLIYNIETRYLNASGIQKIKNYVWQFFWRLFFFSMFGFLVWQDFLRKVATRPRV